MAQRVLGKELHTASLLYKRAADACPEIKRTNDLTGTHGHILGYLMRSTKEQVFQKDIERAFCLRRSTATEILQLMERNGLIVRQSVDYDARLKQIVVTDKGREICNNTRAAFERLQQVALTGVAPDDMHTFYCVLDAIKSNLGCPLCETDD